MFNQDDPLPKSNISTITAGIQNLWPRRSSSAPSAAAEQLSIEKQQTSTESNDTVATRSLPFSLRSDSRVSVPPICRQSEEGSTDLYTCPGDPPGSSKSEFGLTDNSSSNEGSPRRSQTPPPSTLRDPLSVPSHAQNPLSEYIAALEDAQSQLPPFHLSLDSARRARRGAVSVSRPHDIAVLRGVCSSGVSKVGSRKPKVSFLTTKQEKEDEAVCDDSDTEMSVG